VGRDVLLRVRGLGWVIGSYLGASSFALGSTLASVGSSVMTGYCHLSLPADEWL